MDAENQHPLSKADSPAKSILGDKWFWPIWEELEKFGNLTGHLFPEVNAVLEEGTPTWVFESAWLCGKDMADYNGLAESKKIDARCIGKMIGATWNMCDAYAKAFLFWSTLKPEDIRKIDAAFWPGLSHACLEITRDFAEKWTPLFREIKRRATNLVSDQDADELDYFQGYMQGKQFVSKLWEKTRQTQNKRKKDTQARYCVFHFAMCCGRLIEDEKQNLSWPELHQIFLEAFDHKVDIDEDAFKKILSRAGLKGVGKAGRIPSNEIGTPRIPRCP